MKVSIVPNRRVRQNYLLLRHILMRMGSQFFSELSLFGLIEFGAEYWL